MALYAKYSTLGNKETPSTECLSLQSADHKNKIIKSNTVVCIDIYADWCSPCKRIAPDYAKMAAHYNNPGRCTMVKEDLDLKLSDNIKQVPTFHFYKKGVFVHSISGADLTKVDEVMKQLTTEE